MDSVHRVAFVRRKSTIYYCCIFVLYNKVAHTDILTVVGRCLFWQLSPLAPTFPIRGIRGITKKRKLRNVL